MSDEPLDPRRIRSFHDDGYLVIEDLLDAEEVDLLGRIARADRVAERSAVGRRDGEGGTIRLSVGNTLGDDVQAAIVRGRRIVGKMETLLGDEVYHYHHKTIYKDPRTGGAWEWHQDYGYWYDVGCLFPDMASCMIAIDRATRANGCLQVLRGSHRMGRINHGPIGDQTGADPERVAAALERFDLVHCELGPGSAVLFHGNLLHRSDQNHSDDPRWAFIACYNTRHNDPYKPSRHPGYTPLEVWPDTKVLEVGRAQWAALQAATTG